MYYELDSKKVVDRVGSKHDASEMGVFYMVVKFCLVNCMKTLGVEFVEWQINIVIHELINN